MKNSEQHYDELKNKYKKRFKGVLKEYGPEILAGGVAVAGFALWGFYMMGLKDGKRIFAHGPCIEVGVEGAKGLLAGKFMILKVAGGDVLYKLVDHEPV